MVLKKVGVVVGLCLISFAASAGGVFGPKKGDLLEGDKRDACEIKVCLQSMGVAYEQCDRAMKVWERTKPEKRPELLRKCPEKE